MDEPGGLLAQHESGHPSLDGFFNDLRSEHRRKRPAALLAYLPGLKPTSTGFSTTRRPRPPAAACFCLPVLPRVTRYHWSRPNR